MVRALSASLCSRVTETVPAETRGCRAGLDSAQEEVAGVETAADLRGGLRCVHRRGVDDVPLEAIEVGDEGGVHLVHHVEVLQRMLAAVGGALAGDRRVREQQGVGDRTSEGTPRIERPQAEDAVDDDVVATGGELVRRRRDGVGDQQVLLAATRLATARRSRARSTRRSRRCAGAPTARSGQPTDRRRWTSLRPEGRRRGGSTRSRRPCDDLLAVALDDLDGVLDGVAGQADLHPA